jgi:hypothetical protein
LGAALREARHDRDATFGRTRPELERIEAEPQAAAPQDGEVGGNNVAEEPVSELIEHVGFAAVCSRYGRPSSPPFATHLSCGERPLIVVAALRIALAFLTAFALANRAAVSAFSGPLPG